jgi:hypothetical protein
MADKSFTQSYIGRSNGYLLLLYILGFKALGNTTLMNWDGDPGCFKNFDSKN